MKIAEGRIIDRASEKGPRTTEHASTTVHPAAQDPAELLAQCTNIPGRASGPGGQRRNKVQTAVRLVHRPTGIEGAATERRSRVQNQGAALFRLRVNLALQVRRPSGPTLGPGDLWRSRCRGGRVSINPGHDDFPAMLAEALDALEACDMEPQRAAAFLGCSATQVIRLLKHEPRALEWLNAWRHRNHLKPLK